MKKDNLELKIAVVCAIILFPMGAANALYRASSRNGFPFFSIEAVKAGMPYWIGMGLGVVGYLVFWFVARKR